MDVKVTKWIINSGISSLVMHLRHGPAFEMPLRISSVFIHRLIIKKKKGRHSVTLKKKSRMLRRSLREGKFSGLNVLFAQCHWIEVFAPVLYVKLTRGFY